MQMVYNSERYSVVHTNASEEPDLSRHIFEIIDKKSNKEILLDGLWAHDFAITIRSWQEKYPEQSEVERTLSGFAQLAQIPMVLH